MQCVYSFVSAVRMKYRRFMIVFVKNIEFVTCMMNMLDDPCKLVTRIGNFLKSESDRTKGGSCGPARKKHRAWSEHVLMWPVVHIKVSIV